MEAVADFGAAGKTHAASFVAITFKTLWDGVRHEKYNISLILAADVG